MCRRAVAQRGIAGVGELGLLFEHRKGGRGRTRLEVVVPGKGHRQGIAARRDVRGQAAARHALSVGLPGAALRPEREDEARARNRGLARVEAGRERDRIIDVAAGRPGVGHAAFDSGDVDLGGRQGGRVEPITAEAGAHAAWTEWLAGRSRRATGEPAGIGCGRAGLPARSTAQSEAHRPAGQRRGPVLGEGGREVSGDTVDEGLVAPIRERGLLMRDDERDRRGPRLELIGAGVADREREGARGGGGHQGAGGRAIAAGDRGAGLRSEPKRQSAVRQRIPPDIGQGGRDRHLVVEVGGRRPAVDEAGDRRSSQLERLRKEGLLGVGVDGPVHRHALEAIQVVVLAGIEIPPGDARGDRGIEVGDAGRILVDHDRRRIRLVGGGLPGRGDQGVQLGPVDAVAVQQDEVLLRDHLITRLLAALPADADLQFPARTVLDLLDDVGLVGAIAAVQVVGEAGIALVRRLHQDVAVAAVDQPIGDVVDRGLLGGGGVGIVHPLVLAVVEELDHDDDAVVVGGRDHLLEPVHPGGFE